MRRNIRFWSRYTLQVLAVVLIFLAISVVSILLRFDGGFSPDSLRALPQMALMGLLFGSLALGAGTVMLYLPLLVTMGETRRNVLLGYHFYLLLQVAIGVALWTLLQLLTGAPWAEWAPFVPVIALVLVAVSMASSLVGTLYTRYKWVGVLLIALVSGGFGMCFSIAMLSGGGTFGFQLELPPIGWLALGAGVLTALEIPLSWLHFRRREVRL